MIRLIGGSISSSLLVAYGIYSLKQSTMRALDTWQTRSEILPTIFVLLGQLNFWIGLMAYSLAFGIVLMILPYVRVHQFFPLSMVSSLLLTVAMSAFFLGESIPSHRIAGILCVLLGGYLIYR